MTSYASPKVSYAFKCVLFNHVSMTSCEFQVDFPVCFHLFPMLFVDPVRNRRVAQPRW